MKSKLSGRNLSVFALAASLLAASLAPAAAVSAAPRRTTTAQAARRPAPSPAPSPAQAAAPLAEAPPFVNKILPNGLEVIVLEDHSVPLVTVELAVRNGSFTEPPEFNGLSHLFEHMFFKSNRAIPSQERYLQRLRELGASWNGTTSEERVNYYATVGVDSVRPMLQFLEDAIRYPLFL